MELLENLETVESGMVALIFRTKICWVDLLEPSDKQRLEDKFKTTALLPTRNGCENHHELNRAKKGT